MYDQPTNLNLTRYSVMMPVEDLKHLCSRHQRKHVDIILMLVMRNLYKTDLATLFT